MSSKRANKAVIRGQLKGAALSVMEALDAGLTEGMPMGQLRDAAESLRALAEVLGQMESAEKLAETAETLKKQTAALSKSSKSAPGTDSEEQRPGIIEIARVLEDVEEIFGSEALVNRITSRNIDVGELFASSATAGIIHTGHLAADVGGALNLSANGSITMLTGRTEELEAGLEQYDAYFRFDADGLHLGKRGEALELNLRNDRISFLDQQGSEVAYVSSGKLFIANAEITSRLRVGSYTWQKMPDNSLGLMFDP